MVKTLGYSDGGVQDVKRDENGMEVMDLDDDDDEQKVVEEIILSKDSGRGDSGDAQDLLSSPSVMPNPIVETRPPTSLDSQHSQIQLQIPETTRNKDSNVRLLLLLRLADSEKRNFWVQYPHPLSF